MDVGRLDHGTHAQTVLQTAVHGKVRQVKHVKQLIPAVGAGGIIRNRLLLVRNAAINVYWRHQEIMELLRAGLIITTVMNAVSFFVILAGSWLVVVFVVLIHVDPLDLQDASTNCRMA